jgi:hypothetical protein
VRVATADVNGDSRPDIVAAEGPGGLPVVKGFDGLSGREINSAFVQPPGSRDGLFVGGGGTWGALAGRESSSVPAGLPRPDHIVIVIEENHDFAQIIGSPDAPFINSLAQQGAVMTASTAVEHPSQPNYLDLFSGSNQGVTTDARPTGLALHHRNLGADSRPPALASSVFSDRCRQPALTATASLRLRGRTSTCANTTRGRIG